MSESKFILSKKKLLKQYQILRELGVSISYSYKTNREVGDVLQELTDCYFSIHNFEEIKKLRKKNKIWFFSQAWNRDTIVKLLENGIINFVIDNEIDLNALVEIIKEKNVKVNICLRMKFKEHRVSSGKYFVYGMSSSKINEIIKRIKNNPFIDKIGIHFHRKTQNTSEWDIINEIKDSLIEESLERLNLINLGGGLPVKYKSHSADVLPYILNKIKEVIIFLKKYSIETIIEPGRFISAPAIKLETEIIQIYDNVVILNCSVYNSAIDTIITNIKLLIEHELSDDSPKGKYYLIKGNTPTRDDIFRYKVKLDNPQVGDKLTFLNAGAYNWKSDFCCLKKLKTEVVEDFNTEI